MNETTVYQRLIDVKGLSGSRSLFLFGPRSTGKSFWLKQSFPAITRIDLLNNDIFLDLLRKPTNLANYFSQSNKLVIIDEIQKIPALLDEVHRQIEDNGFRFILTGSSARKLKRSGANLLGGRARNAAMCPLVSAEIPGFDLLKYCTCGGLPYIYNSDLPWQDLKDYVALYIREEIQQESAVRGIDQFVRFLDIFGRASGEELNYLTISSQAAVPERTVSNYVEILKDTLLVNELLPFRGSSRKAVKRSKIYFFDVGVANYLAGRKSFTMKSDDFGKAFEHFIVQEIAAYINYRQLDRKLYYWRTYEGDEVDLIIDNEIAIEIKSTERVLPRHLKGLGRLRDGSQVKQCMLISCDTIEKNINNIACLPVGRFLSLLWGDQLIN